MSPILIATLSLVLYTYLLVTCFYHYCQYTSDSVDKGKGQFHNSKRAFFFILAISSALDLPAYVGCVIHNGPPNCQWNSVTYSFCWIFHLLALVGYAMSLGIPLFLWSDIYHGRDGNLFRFSQYSDFTKPFLHISIVCYFSVQLMTICALLFSSDLQNPDNFHNHPLNVLAKVLDPILILLISAIWLFTGIRLQLYVVNVCFRPLYEKRILFVINTVMFTVLCSYLLRATMIISLFLDSHHIEALNELGRSYTLWVIFTRWVPNIFCSLVLVHLLHRPVDASSATSESLLLDDGSKSNWTSFALLSNLETDEESISNIGDSSLPSRADQLNSSSGSSTSFLRDFDFHSRYESSDMFFSSTHDFDAITNAPISYKK